MKSHIKSATTLSPDRLEQIAHNLPCGDPELIPTAIPGMTEQAVIPVADLHLGGNEARYVKESLDKGWISSAGHFVTEFEDAFSSAVGCQFGAACSSGTNALHLAVAASDIGPGCEVIIPTFTMIATINAVAYTGATPVLVDSEPDTGNIDPALIEEKITPRTKAIIVVHVYGHPADMDAINDIAHRHDLTVIEDAAEAHGAYYKGRPCGSLGHAAAFSFYANKIITTGEGVMVTASNEDWIKVARCLRDHAFSSDRHFWHRHVGFNYRMSNIQAAIGVGQTERLKELADIRRNHAFQYMERLRHVDGIILPVEKEYAHNVYWMFGIQVDKTFPLDRDELRRHLGEHGIETRTYFIPMHYQPVWFEAFEGQAFPVSERMCKRGVYLPSGPCLTRTQIDYICQTIEAAVGEASLAG